MHWSDWVVIAWLALGTLATIGQIGQPRKPIEPAVGIFSIIFTAGIGIMLILTHA